MRNRSAGLTFFLLAFLLPVAASAQAWLADRSDSEGPGFKLGESNLVLHTGLGVEGGFDSNALYDNQNIKAGRLRITPYLDIATRSRQRLASKEGAVKLTPPKAIFSFGLATYYDRYFATDEGDVDNLNSGFNPFGIDTHLDLTILPKGKVSVITGINYVKTLEPYESSSTSQDRHQLTPKFGLRFSPGGGMLHIKPQYIMNLLYFSDPAAAEHSNRMTHGMMLDVNWKFLPRTSLVSKTLFSPNIYYGSGTNNVNSLPLRAFLGVQSLIANKFGVRGLIGYGASFYDSGPDFESVIGDLSLMFFVNEFARITLGANRDFVDSFYGNYYDKIGGSLKYEHMFGGVFLVSVQGGADYRRYAHHDASSTDPATGIALDANTSDRRDVWATGALLLQYRAADWLSFHASAKIWADITDFTVYRDYRLPDGSQVSETIPIQYSKFEAFGGIRFHY